MQILRWRLFGGFCGCPILRNTILDKIAEFAKIIAGLNFCVRATLRLRLFECPPDTAVLKISSLPKWASSESRYEPPCAKLASCLLKRRYTVLLTNSCAAAARFLRTPIKADTKSIGHILCSDEHSECHCLSLSGQKSSKDLSKDFLQIRNFG